FLGEGDVRHTRLWHTQADFFVADEPAGVARQVGAVTYQGHVLEAQIRQHACQATRPGSRGQFFVDAQVRRGSLPVLLNPLGGLLRPQQRTGNDHLHAQAPALKGLRQLASLLAALLGQRAFGVFERTSPALGSSLSDADQVKIHGCCSLLASRSVRWPLPRNETLSRVVVAVLVTVLVAVLVAATVVAAFGRRKTLQPVVPVVRRCFPHFLRGFAQPD